MNVLYKPSVTNLPPEFHQESVVRREPYERPRRRYPRLFRESVVQQLSDLQLGQGVIYDPSKVAVDPGIKDLFTLRLEEGLTEEPITDHAFKTAMQLLQLIRVVFRGRLAAPLIAPDCEGGLRMEWFLDETNIRVVIPPDVTEDSYVYVRSNGESAVRPFTPSNVIRMLRSRTLNA